MTDFTAMMLPADPTVVAPDGSDVRVLLATNRGSMAHFQLAPGRIARAIVHRTVDEIWYVVDGRGEMWRRQGDREETVILSEGLCLTIPAGTHFQFRADEHAPLSAIAITMPPWPGADEAQFIQGPWADSPVVK